MNRGARILIVDDEQDICEILFRVLEREGFRPMVAHSGETALEMINLGMPDLVILDVKMPGLDGMEVLKLAKRIDGNLPILMITAWGGIDGAVQAVKEGADDYLAKPLNHAELILKIKKVLDEDQPSRLKRTIHDVVQNRTVANLKEIMGPSEIVARISSEVALVAPSNFSVVIQGETGTGKELITRAIHEASLRSGAALIPVDCGAIPETLFESELFGYEKGAFTGAAGSKPGKFEMAQNGTLFLDEISNMPLSSQIKLLRAIQEKSFFRVGGTRPVNVNVRLIVATNEDLNNAIRKGSFSRDLFYRLSEFTIIIPPLRERKNDILHLANRFLEATNVELDKKVSGFSDEALQALMDNQWPGNVRQLRSAIRRAVLQADSWIAPEHLSLEESRREIISSSSEPVVELGGLSLKELVRRSTTEIEIAALTEALRKCGGNKAKAARLLQIDYTTIHSKIKHYGIKIDNSDN